MRFMSQRHLILLPILLLLLLNIIISSQLKEAIQVEFVYAFHEPEKFNFIAKLQFKNNEHWQYVWFSIFQHSLPSWPLGCETLGAFFCFGGPEAWAVVHFALGRGRVWIIGGFRFWDPAAVDYWKFRCYISDEVWSLRKLAQYLTDGINIHSYILIVSLFNSLCNNICACIVCMDGTPPAYHLDAGSGAGNNSWIVNLEVSSSSSPSTYMLSLISVRTYV